MGDVPGWSASNNSPAASRWSPRLFEAGEWRRIKKGRALGAIVQSGTYDPWRVTADLPLGTSCSNLLDNVTPSRYDQLGGFDEYFVLRSPQQAATHNRQHAL